MDLFGFHEVKISKVNDFIRNQLSILASGVNRYLSEKFPHCKIERKDIKIDFYHAPECDGAISMSTIKIHVPYAYLATLAKIVKEEILPQIKEDDVRRNIYMYTIENNNHAICIGFNVKGFVQDVSASNDVIPF